MLSKSTFVINRPLTVLFAFWAITQIVILYKYGIKTSIDTALYVDGAEALLDSFKISGAHEFWYASYILLLAILLKFTGSLVSVTAVQILLSGAALAALYKAVLLISKNNLTAFAAAFLYIFWFEIHSWNIFIYTESLFISCSVLSFYFLLRAQRPVQFAGVLLFVLFTCLIRPAGISLFVATLIFCFYRLNLSTGIRKMIGIGIAIVALALVNKMLESFELISSYAKAEIIYPNIPFLLQKPETLEVPSKHLTPLVRLACFIFYNPIYFVKLCALKLTLFFAHIKPYFSVIHNIYVAVILYPLYFLAIRAGWVSQIAKPVLIFLVAFIGLQALTVMLTTENWDGRFLLPALPFIFILSAFGVTDFIKGKVESESGL